MKANERTPLRPCNAKELAAMYGVSTKTLRSWLDAHKQEIGVQVGRCFTIKQLNIIFELIGPPE